ncbi:hypothetical protein AB1Y20_000746 [Prymnesium parvum]|uniref:PPM-type phosphatase domain-containing protein n=1 Tax=Prymnesium parvum TaxID=97485 RepID=A0AB34K5P7_PRYPA
MEAPTSPLLHAISHSSHALTALAACLTPSSYKRSRDGAFETSSFEPASKRMELTPCCYTPIGSPKAGTEHMATTPAVSCVTPLANCRLGSTNLAREIGVRWSTVLRQGPRSNMEDTAVSKLCNDQFEPHAFFGVFDGHGGADASEFCAENLHENVVQSQHYPDVVTALKDGFLQTDADFLNYVTSSRGRCKAADAGSAAVTLMVTASHLAVAYVGDCRALLIKHNGDHVELSNDHTAELHEGCNMPIRPDEAARVSRTGASMDHGYVNVGDDSLPMTRAVGDLRLKVAKGHDWRWAPATQQVVTALPEVRKFARSADDLCVVLASDGVFGNVMTSAQVASITRRVLKQFCGCEEAEQKAAAELADCAYKQHQSSDNIGIIVVALDPPQCHVELNHQLSQESMASTESFPPSILLPIESKIHAPFFKAYPPRQNYRNCDKENVLHVPCLRTIRAPGPLAYLPPDLRDDKELQDLEDDDDMQ